MNFTTEEVAPLGVPASPIGAPGAKYHKLAEAIASRLESDVVAAGWPVGVVLGNEQSLADRYGVGRAVIREAVRLVEHHQVARTRRGRNGGLVVIEPDVSAVVESMSIYLEYLQVSINDLFEARAVLELFSVRLAADRLDEDQLVALRRDVEDESANIESYEGRDRHRMHDVIAESTNNAALSLFVRTTVTLTYRFFRTVLGDGPRSRTAPRETHRAHAAIVNAIVHGDGFQARHRMLRHLSALQQSVLRLADTVWDDEGRGEWLAPAADDAAGRSGRPADVLAGRIRADIARKGWPVGESLGYEPDLLKRYDVSRAVFREAVRILEHQSVISMRRGHNGGMIVERASDQAVIHAVALYLEYCGITPAQLDEVREEVEAATVRLAIERLTPEGVERLNSVLEMERTCPDADFRAVSHQLHIVIAELSGNRTLALLLSILGDLAFRYLRKARRLRGESPVSPDEIRRVHRKVVEAIIDGDAPLAMKRMRIHLQALADWMREP